MTKKRKKRKTPPSVVMINAGFCLSCMVDLVSGQIPTTCPGANQGDIVTLSSPHGPGQHPVKAARANGNLCNGPILVVKIPVEEPEEVWDEIKGIMIPVEGSGGSVWRHIVAAIMDADPNQLKQLQVDGFIHPEVFKNPTLGKAITARIAEAA